MGSTGVSRLDLHRGVTIPALKVALALPSLHVANCATRTDSQVLVALLQQTPTAMTDCVAFLETHLEHLFIPVLRVGLLLAVLDGVGCWVLYWVRVGHTLIVVKAAMAPLIAGVVLASLQSH